MKNRDGSILRKDPTCCLNQHNSSPRLYRDLTCAHRNPQIPNRFLRRVKNHPFLLGCSTTRTYFGTRKPWIVGDIGDNHKVKLGKMDSGLWVSPRALPTCSCRWVASQIKRVVCSRCEAKRSQFFRVTELKPACCCKMSILSAFSDQFLNRASLISPTQPFK